jgi:hypothetical protein
MANGSGIKHHELHNVAVFVEPLNNLACCEVKITVEKLLNVGFNELPGDLGSLLLDLPLFLGWPTRALALSALS